MKNTTPEAVVSRSSADRTQNTDMNTQTPDRNATTDGNLTSHRTLSIDRRTLLKTVSLGTAMGMAGCQEAIGRIGGSANEHVPFDVWEELRAALRTSPDHLPARAEQLVAEGDPEALFQFVRDEIITYPAGVDWFSDDSDQMRWGVRGTLRGGAGTPREKAELLAELYRRAGWKAEVLVGSGLETPEQTKRLLWRPVERRFAPDIDEAQIEQWQQRVGQSSEETPATERIDEKGNESRRLGKRLFGQLQTEELSPVEFDWDSGDLPVVRVVADGTEHYADLFALDAPFGETRVPVEDLEAAPETTETLPVEVTLSAATADASEEPFDLVSGTWSADELVGRQLLVQTLPGIDPFERPDVTFQDIQTFLPALTMQAMDLNRKEMTELSVMGDAVTRTGDRLHVEKEGTVTRNGEPFVAPDAGAAAADVAELRVSANSGRFPEVRLNVHALDARGKPVEGLPATAFEVRDGDQPVGVAMTTNEQAPRVLILSDTSLSMPSHYLGEGMEELVATLRERVLAKYPNARIDQEDTNSDIWTALGDGAGSDANLIVYATDGHVNDELTPEIRTALRQGPPAVMLSVNDDKTDENLQQMATLTDGTLEAASDHAAAKDAIMDYLVELVPKLPTYVLTYGAPTSPDASGKRQVTVRVTGSDADGTDNYRIPDSAALPPHLAGLYLTTTIDDREVTRTLAGYDPVRHAEQPATQAMVDEVMGALFGSHTLSFEAAAPSPSVWLDDILTAKLSVAGLNKAVVAEDSKKLDRALDTGFSFVQPEFSLLTGPLPDAVTDRSLTFQNGLRVALYQERPVFGEKHVVRHADLLPFADFATAATDPEEGFRLTLEKTARLAVVESALFETSTRSLLAGKRLGPFETVYDSMSERGDEEQADQWDRLFDQYEEYGGYNLLPADGTPLAFWNINEETGELVGVLPDGSGGGSTLERVREMIHQIDRVMTMYKLLAMAAPGGFALAVVASYGQTLARLYGAASLAIAAMDTSQLGEQVQEAIAHLVCNVARQIVFKGIGNWVLSAMDKILSIAGANPAGCPG
jgi:hypothetical protein